MTTELADHNYMIRALQLARNGIRTTDPNPHVGCVLVRDDRIVGEGWHQRAGGPHAEIVALQAAGKLACGATAYVTLEPCSHHGRTGPCADALIEAGVSRVVAAMQDPNPLVSGQGLEKLARGGVDTLCGIQQQAAESLNAGFCKRMRSGRPRIFSKLAMSLDGRTAMASGESTWITGSQARDDVQRLRAGSSAILTGSGTLLYDNPRLSVRLEGVERQPVRIVLDSALRTPQDAAILSEPGDTWLVSCQPGASRRGLLEAAGFKIVCLPAGPTGSVDLDALADWMGEQGFNNVMVEAGATLNGALLAAGLLDELVVYMAPHVMGADARGLFRLPGLLNMSERISLQTEEVAWVGRDLRLSYKVAKFS